MRQDFDVRGGPAVAPRNLPKLRAAMSDMGLDGFFVPHEDEYQNEYLPDANERLAWATGFTGSAGASWVFKDNAVLFVDGRYTIQVAEQTPPDLFQYVAMPEPGPFGWIATIRFCSRPTILRACAKPRVARAPGSFPSM